MKARASEIEKMATQTKTPTNSFANLFPQGVQLSQDVIDLFEAKRKQRQAMTFDEVSVGFGLIVDIEFIGL